ncbi:MAG: hypothetical protein GOMPHAMPRED_008179 [Gomphillus americanus]|uniref:Cupredoxin n=1 Tax=Gomphillus americanus TaxID=1940652 RepID=A0A8H3F551_9LECA|nr:MAG: hypothetical protein GOMPHAMPRED_008179 [Gomphillus americanus]
MHFINTVAASLLLAGSALAASGSSIVVHVVNVSVRGPNNTLTYSPQNTQAQPGEVVQFQFQNGNHSVAQSTFAQPCIPINNVMSNVTGFFSGFLPTPQPASSIPTYSVMVNNTKPVWFYCAQGKHCEKGMVGAINAPTTGDKTVAAFAALAAQVQGTIIPGGSNSTSSSDGSASSSASGSTTMATAATSGSSSSSTSASSSSSVPSSGAAAGSLFASSQQVLAGGFAAALLSAALL